MSDQCISSAVLRSYLRGESSGVDLDQIEIHLRRCRECQTKIERLADVPDSVMHRAAEVIPSQAVAGDQALELAASRQGSRRHSVSQDLDGRNATASKVDSGGSQVEAGVAQHATGEFAMERIRDYKLLDCIGQGGMGKVYRAWHCHLNKIVAVKLLRSEGHQSQEAKGRFAREMTLLAGLEHPQMVRALDAGEDQGVQYFAMEFVPGVDLGQLLQRLGPLPVPEVCAISRLTADVLAFAHGHKVIHRDIKPSNLMLTPEGNVKLLDLGLAQIFDLPEQHSLSRSGHAVGTLAYMAPELLAGNSGASPRLDIYSLGVTICEMLIGFRPFEAPGTLPMIQDIRVLRPDVPAELNALVQRMISLDPNQRPASMDEVQEDLMKVVAQSDLTSLVAEYYRWTNRPSLRSLTNSPPPVTPPPVTNSGRPESITTVAAVSSPRRGTHFTPSMRDWVLKHLGWFLGFTCLFLMLYWMAADRLSRSESMGLMSWGTSSNRESESVADDPIEGRSRQELKTSDQSTRQDEAGRAVSTEAQVTVSAVGDVSRQLLEEGRVTITHLGSDVRRALNLGDQRLPVGEYVVHFDCPVEIEEQQLSVLEDSINPWSIQATLKHRFQFPSIPRQIGAYASYYGNIWKEGWPKENGNTYEFSIRILGSNGYVITPRNETWVQVNAKHLADPGGYSEEAYLKIDMLRWEDAQQFHVLEGFVNYEGEAIKRYLRQHDLGASEKSLVLPFYEDRDPVAELRDCELPATRLSVQDFLTLFFGTEELSAADSSFRELRAKLAGPGRRHAWLAEFHNGRGSVPCYVASSRTKQQSSDQFGYSLWRRDAELFDFVQVEVNLPTVKATCLLKNESPGGDTKLEREFLRLEQLSQSIVQPEELEDRDRKEIQQTGTSRPFDLASLPESEATVIWRGEIERNGNRETIEIEAICRGRSKREQRELCWLEFKVSSQAEGNEHIEWARLGIDVDEYEQRDNVLIDSGWIAYARQDNVFPIPSDGDLRRFANARIQRQTPDAFGQMGAVDTLAMLFNAKLQPKSDFEELRRRTASVLAGQERAFENKQKRLKFGIVNGQIWQQPALSPFTYEIFKSQEIPFGFVSASLTIPKMLTLRNRFALGLEVQKHFEKGSRSVFQNADDLNRLAQKNREYIAARAKEGWRVWTWEHGGELYKTWAEFGGTFSVDAAKNARMPDRLVVLNLANGQSMLVIHAELNKQDREFADQGRFWATWPSQKLVLLDYNPRTRILTAWRKMKTGNAVGQELTWTYDEMPREDKAWVDRFQNAKSPKSGLSWRTADVVEAWDQPTVYRLPTAYR